MKKSLRLLLVDDTESNLQQMGAVAHRLGHQVIVARDGYEALEKYQAERPELIFMDIMMPRMDGIEAVRRIRALPGDKWVPIVYYSALDNVRDIVRGLEAGGDDYLVKPANLRVIQAKINSYARLIALQDQLHASKVELQAWREEAEEQNRLGHFVISRLVDAEGLRDPMLRWKNIPAQTFSGDLVCATRGPGDVLFLMLADAAGHGLHAALTALPMTQVFYGMAAKGFPIDTIAEELNRKLKELLPIDRFVATILAAVDSRNQTIELWNGGNPEALFVAVDGDIDARWPSQHMPLGILSPADFSGATETFNYQRGGELVLCSDGVIEAEDAAGQRFDQDKIEALLRASPSGRRCAALERGVLDHLGDRRNHDDISWMVVDVATAAGPARRLPKPGDNAGPVSEWRMELAWGPSELRHLDVAPAVLGFMGQVEALRPHRGPLFLIVSELFNNALDHGLLGLDSRIKRQEGGFERYLEERSLRLARLTDGMIEMRFHLRLPRGQPVLDIEVADSGPGFDYAFYTSRPVDFDDLGSPYGRGINLVRSLCAEVAYGGHGNRVQARYALQAVAELKAPLP